MGDADGPLWVFGYGSLIWKTGFEHDDRRLARLSGYRRAFCLRSVRWRGTPAAPGLVLGLAPAAEAECVGLAFRVPPARAAEVRAYLHDREMGTYSYVESFVSVALDGGPQSESEAESGAEAGPEPETVHALAYVMDTAHPSFVRLPLLEQARIIARAEGPAGPNRDYLHHTVAHLRALGLRDAELERLDRLVRRITAEDASAASREIDLTEVSLAGSALATRTDATPTDTASKGETP